MTPQRHPLRLLVALATALLTVAAVLTPGPVSAQDSALSIEFTNRAQHHGKAFKVTLNGLDGNEELRIRECAGELTGDECVGGWGANAGKHPADSTWRIAGQRWHVADGELVDCAEIECFLEVTNGDRTARKAIDYSTNYPMPQIEGDFTAVVAGQVVEGQTNRFVRANKRGRNVGIMQCVTASSPSLRSNNSCETVLANTQLVTPFQVTPLQTLDTDDGRFDCTAIPGSCELRIWSYPSYLAFPAGAPLTFVEGNGSEPEVSATISKTTNIKPFEKLILNVVSPYKKLTIAVCASRTDSDRTTCNKTRRRAPGLVDGKSTTRTIQMRPGRFVSRVNTWNDCADPNFECHVAVTSGQQSIAQIPISFDSSVPTEAPSIVAPKGPFTEGETIEIKLRGLRPNSKVQVQCFYVGCNERIDTKADADGTAAVDVTIDRDPEFPDRSRHIRVKTQPKVRPSRISVAFD